MRSTRKPRWQQATALVSLSTAGAVTGLSFAHGTTADLTSPSRIPVKLMASQARAGSASASDAALRTAIVKSAQYYLRLAQSRSPSQMEALIWQGDSLDGADHGESCAAFASLTLEAGAQATGQQSWVSGGSTYPWPMHQWADARVDANPDSMNIISVVQDAQAHQRWHAVGDGYTPQPGDWVLFHGHVEVVTKYSGGVLHTIGGDSLPNFSVNAHQYEGSLAAAGVTGFVNNGELASTASQAASGSPSSASGSSGSGSQAAAHGASGAQGTETASTQLASSAPGQAAVPGLVAPSLSLGASGQATAQQAGSLQAQQGQQGQAQAQPSDSPTAEVTVAGAASIPGSAPVAGSVTSYSPVSAGSAASSGSSASSAAATSAASATARYSRSQPEASTAAVSESSVQQAFINAIAPGAVAAQKQYGVPAAVTIAQAIDESGWGQSKLAAQDKNLFGIKGTGPAGSVLRPTQEYQNGQAVTISAPFRAYTNMAQSISDHGLLLATGSSYKQAMADRRSPDAFANDLTGIYATDPNYGASLISLMRQYNLYRFDAATSQASSTSQGASSSQGSSASQASSATSAGGGAVHSAGGAGASSTATSGAKSGQKASGGSGSGTGGSGAGTSGQAGSETSGSGQAELADGAAIPGAVQPGDAVLGMAVNQKAGAATAQAAGSKGSASGPTAGGTGSARPAGAKASSQAGGTGSGSKAPQGAGSSGRAPGGTTGGGGAERAEIGTAQDAGSANIPGVLDGSAGAAAVVGLAARARLRPGSGQALRAGPRNARVSLRRYVPQVPRVVTTDFASSAEAPLLRAKPVYQEVGAIQGIRWELLAACDWMQCQAQPGISPVYGEPLGARNPDGTVYRSKPEALEQVAGDLIELAAAVYGIDLRQRLLLSVRELASVFAAFRWGGLLKTHRVSVMDFPYSVEGLTAYHVKMRWPDIPDRAPDKPGTRFRMPFGAVPVVLGLNYPAIA